MTIFNEIINNINNRIIDKDLQFYVKQIIKSWFIKLNKDDIEIITIMGTYLIQRISKLFLQNRDHLRQLKQNNNQDIRSILLLLLPYINDEKINVYANITDLNELILTDKLLPSDFELERSQILKTHFKFTNIGIGLIDKNNKIELNDNDYEIKLNDTDDGKLIYKGYGKLIYKILYHNFIALNETLSIINGKLYINWINISPLTENNYTESTIYKNTTTNLVKALQNLKEYKYNDIYEYDGLYIGEFYNVYRNVYYESIKKIKWLIFIVNDKYIIQFLNDIFNFDMIFLYNSFDDLPIIEKELFSNILNNLIINNEREALIWKNIIIFLINNYSLKNIVKDKFINKQLINKFNIDIEEGKTDDLKHRSLRKLNEVSDNEVKLFFNIIEKKYIWNFIKESLILLQSTIYSNYLINNNKINTNFINFDNSDLNLKNVYNIAKSLSHNDNWVLLPIKYSSLTIDEQKTFWNKFNLTNSNWINLRNNLNLEKGRNLSDIEYNNFLNNKLNSFNVKKYDLVWFYLIKNGILSEFKTNFEINDPKEYGLDRFKSIKTFFGKNLDQYKDAYYYLTNKKYKDHIFRNNDGSDISLMKNLNDMKWYTFYAMDWISQIGFYHHYLNHRVLYITGATGQGKSTQVPKLFLYSLKMLDYKSDGKVICTQPRIGPTNSNANRISDELGVPIEQYSKTLKEKIKSENYYVQLSHSNDKHVKLSCSHPTLKILTDGSLLTEVIKNPFLKEDIIIKENNKYLDAYGEKNKYDIIIIDEAHEHNTNMDLLLTLIRHSCYINNDLKLIIMSATMDDDEPNFRSYYKIINDNLVYPLREQIPKYFSNTDYISSFFLYENIYLDRRFHIAPPGKSTQYDILEYYEPKGETIKIVKEIIESSSMGDILIFENGEKEVNKRITELNKIITNKNIIALPYYSKLNNKYKIFIEVDLDKNINKLRIDKNKVATLWNENYTESNDLPEGTYDRCIIVATNVAEASITLNNLKFVIDNGFAKVNSYNYSTDTIKLEPDEISEASRKQRKGRVGRVSSGTVYYLYEKGSREKNIPKLKITQENFGLSLIKLLETRKNINTQCELIQNDKYDPNIYDTFIKNYSDSNIENNLKNLIFYKKNIFNIIKKQYNFRDYYIYWHPEYYDFMETNHLEYMYKLENGFKLETLADLYGKFYIIHPFEDKITRNIKGEIIGYFLQRKSYFKNNLNVCIFADMLLNLNYKYLLINLEKENKIDLNKFIKTEFVDFIYEMDEYLSWNEKTIEDIIIMLTSKAYGSFNDVLEILTLIKTLNGSITNLFVNKKIPNNYIYQDKEIELLFNIINDFKKSFNYFRIFEIKNYQILENKYKYEAEMLVNNFLIDYNKNKLDPPKNKYTVKLWNKLSKAYNNGKLRMKEGFMDFVGDMFNYNDEIFNFRNYNNEINLWCSNRNIDTKMFISYLENYSGVLLNILTIKKDYNPEKNELDPLEKMEIESTSFIKSLTRNNELETIIRPFLHGYPFNIGFKCRSNDNFYKTIPIFNIENSTLPNKAKLILYLNKRDKIGEKNSFIVNITNKIEIEWLFSALPYYYKPSNFNNLVLKNNGLTYNISETYGDLFDDFCVKIKNKWSVNNIPFESTELPILKELSKILKKIE